MKCKRSTAHRASPKKAWTGLFAGSSPTATLHPPDSGKAPLNLWILSITIIGILVVCVLFSLIYFSTAQVSTKSFSYNPPRDPAGSYHSISIFDVDGLVNILSWSQSSLYINGTATARGLGSSLSTVSISNSTNNGNVVFRASFPVTGGFFFSQSYSVSINVFVPSTIRLASVQVSNTNGGVRIHSTNATAVNLTSVNGALSIDCAYCQTVTALSTSGNIDGTFLALATGGSYNLTTTNGNIGFTAPSSSSFKLKASGSVSCTFPGCSTSGQGVLVQTFGSGNASVSLTSSYGQITIRGT
jgi:LSD1 subclass zinc finger protein